MNFELTLEQRMLRDSLAGYLSRHRDQAAPARAAGIDVAAERRSWRMSCVDLGIGGLTFPPAAGGLGGGPVETMLVMQEFGRALVHGPYLSTVVLAGGVLSRCGDAASLALIEGIVAGSTIFAFAHNEEQTRFRLGSVRTAAKQEGGVWRLTGCKSVALGAPLASHLLVTARCESGVSLFVVETAAAGVSMETYRAIDGQGSATVRFDSAEALSIVGAAGDGLRLLEPAIDDAIVALCAESVGIIGELIVQTAAYLSQRKQFGQPLSAFQALQHRLADMVLHRERATSMLYMAVLADDPQSRPARVSAAKIVIDRAMRFVGQQAVQLHGGMGITDELAIGRYFKRGLVIGASFGSEDDHFRRYDAAVNAA